MFIIRNISGGQVLINDLGISLQPGDEHDLSIEAASDVYQSADLRARILAAEIAILDPFDVQNGLSPIGYLTTAESNLALDVVNDPNFRTFGTTITQLDDVIIVPEDPLDMLVWDDGMQAWTNQTADEVVNNLSTSIAEIAGPLIAVADLLDTAAGSPVIGNVLRFTGGSPETWSADFLPATDVTALSLAGSTYTRTQDFINIVGSRGIFSGGVFTDNLDGTIDVSGGTGQIHDTNSTLSPLYFIDFPAATSLALTDNALNYIFVDYNGGTPQIVTSTTPNFDSDFIILGQAYRSGTNVTLNNWTRLKLDNSVSGIINRFESVQPFERESGVIISATGTRNFAVTAGAFWEGIDRLATVARDTSASDTFTYWYRTAPTTWVSVPGQTQIDNVNYNDPSSGLVALGNKNYGSHWVYYSSEPGGLHVVYGITNANLDTTQASQPPPNPPNALLTKALIGRILIKKNDAAFTEVQSAFNVVFTGAVSNTHNELGGLQGGITDEYYHTSAAQNTTVVNLDALGTGVVAKTGTGTFAARTLTAGTGISITNGDGVAGNPTISATGGGGSPVVPGGVSTNIQYNDSGSFGGASLLNVNATGGLDISEQTTPATPSADTLRLYAYDNSGLTVLRYRTPEGLEIQMSRDQVLIVRNETGATIPALFAVYESGTNGSGEVLVELAQANSNATVPALGIAVAPILNNTSGRIITSGIISGIDTSGLSTGDVVYLSDTVAGFYSLTPPAPPNLRQRVARVLVADVSGSIFVLCRQEKGNEIGTNSNSWWIGDGAAGAKSIQFANTNVLTLQATPTTTRTVTIPDADGTLALLANDLAAVEGLSGTGIAVRTAADTWTNRSLTQPAAGLTITNNDGVSGNPTFALANDLGAIEALNTNAILVRTGTDTWAARTLTQPAAGLTITNPAGTAGNPTFALANDLAAVEGLATTGFAVRTGTDTWATRTLTAGTNVTFSNADGVAGNPTVNAVPAGVNTNVQYNNSGVFGGDNAFNFVSGANPHVDITGTTATNQLRIGGFTPAEAANATVFIETSNGNQDGQLIYFNSGSAATSGYISYAYDGSTPYLRLTDADDDPPYISFNTIGTGTYTNPLYASVFGARGAYGSRTAGNNSGFSWHIGANTNGQALITANTPVMELDTQFLRVPTGTTAARPGTPAVGMERYNTTLGQSEQYVAGGAWGQVPVIIDKSVVTFSTTSQTDVAFLSYSVPGGTLSTTNMLRIRAAGTWVNGSGATRTVDLAITYGGTTMWADTSATIAGGTDVAWNIDVILASNNATGAQTLNGIIHIGGTGTPTTGAAGDASSDEITTAAVINGTAAVNSAAAQTFTMTVENNGTTSTWAKNFHFIEKI